MSALLDRLLLHTYAYSGGPWTSCWLGAVNRITHQSGFK